MNLVLTMSLAGGVIIGVYLLLLPLIKRYFTARWRYFILKLAGIFFLVPFPYYKHYYLDFISFIFNITRKEYILSGQIDLQHIQIDINDRIISGINEIFNVFTVTWFGVGLVFFTYQIINYIQFKRRLLVDAQIVVDEKTDSIIKNYKSKLCLKSNIKILNNKFIVEPFTIGILFPIIFLPMENYSYEELELILYHEMCHIKNRDLLIKICGLGALSLHWFNPFVYIFYREVGIVCENVCDERIVMDRSIEFRKKYGNLIIDIIEKKEIYKNALIISFSGNKKVTKERILMMKKVREPKILVKILSVSVFICVVMLGSSMIFAYDGAKVIKWGCKIGEVQKRSIISSDGVFNKRKTPLNNLLEGIVFEMKNNMDEEYMFVEENGNYYEMNKEQFNGRCNHPGVSGIVIRHEMYSYGSCSQVLDRATYCAECSHLSILDHINTIKSIKCPH